MLRHYVETRTPDGARVLIVARVARDPVGLRAVGPAVERPSMDVYAGRRCTEPELLPIVADVCRRAGGLAWDCYRALVVAGGASIFPPPPARRARRRRRPDPLTVRFPAPILVL